MKVEILQRRSLHQGFCSLETIQMRYQRFDGSMSQTLEWETLVRDDSVAVVTYDPKQDVVVLIRQFRIGPYLAQQPSWCLEIVAGMCVEGEDLAVTAVREVMEEIGWQVIDLRPIVSYYVSPNISNERLHLFLGLIDSDRPSAHGGGLPHENEDIQVVPVAYAQAIEWMTTGQIQNSPALIGLSWLMQHRDELRREAIK